MKKRLLILVMMSVAIMAACGNSVDKPVSIESSDSLDGSSEEDVESLDETKENSDSESKVEADEENDISSENDENNENKEDSDVVLNADPSKQGAANGITIDDLSIIAGDITIKIDDDFYPYYKEIGEATIEEGQACLEGGFDTNYIYGDEELIVYTVASQGEQLIYDIYVTDGKYKTSLGAEVSVSTKADIESIYGEALEESSNSYFYESADGIISAQFEFDSEDVLKSIDILKK